MAVKLHRCSLTWLKASGHPCWRVQHALDEQGIEYEIVKQPFRPGKRTQIKEMTGQNRLPVIELEDGTAYRDESKAMAERISSGGLQAAA
jgi:glutathione S-transferase